MNSIKVLSIDWDYFVDCPIDFKVDNFPDGGNEELPEFALDQVWMTRYGQCSKLKDVKMDTSEMAKLRMMLKKIVNQSTLSSWKSYTSWWKSILYKSIGILVCLSSSKYL